MVGGRWEESNQEYVFLHKIDVIDGSTEVVFNRNVQIPNTYYCADGFTIFDTELSTDVYYIVAAASPIAEDGESMPPIGRHFSISVAF